MTKKNLDDQFRERCQGIADRLPEDLEYYEQGIGSVALADLDDGDGGLLTPCGCVGVHLHAILQPEGWWTGWAMCYDWENGAKLCADHLDLNGHDLRSVLCDYGGSDNAFQQIPLDTPPAPVFKKLATLDYVQTLRRNP